MTTNKAISKIIGIRKKSNDIKHVRLNSDALYFTAMYGIYKNENLEMMPKFNYIEINVIFETSNIMFKNARTLGAVKFAYTYLCENYRDCGLIWQTLFKQQSKDACRRIRQNAAKREARKTLEFFGL